MELAPTLTLCHPKSVSIHCSSETAAQRKIISLLVEIKEEQQRQWGVLRQMQARVQGQSFPVVEEEVEALDIDIPLRTMEQLDDTERHLEDAGAQKRMVGGPSDPQSLEPATSTLPTVVV